MLMLFLPNIVIAVGIGILGLIIFNQVYLYNHIKLLEVKKILEVNQKQIDAVIKNMRALVQHQISKRVYDSTNKAEVINYLLSEQEINKMNQDLVSIEVLNKPVPINILARLQKLQSETGIFFNRQIESENGEFGFETPLADDPEKINLVSREANLQELSEIKQIAAIDNFESTELQQHFFDFLMFYQTIVRVLLKEISESADTETLIIGYQREASRLLSIQSPADYRYSTLEFWEKILK